MLAGLSEIQRVAEPAANGTVQHWHRHAGAAEAGQDAVDEQVPRIARVVVAFEKREVVRDADVALHALSQCERAKTRFAVLKPVGVVPKMME